MENTPTAKDWAERIAALERRVRAVEQADPLLDRLEDARTPAEIAVAKRALRDAGRTVRSDTRALDRPRRKTRSKAA